MQSARANLVPGIVLQIVAVLLIVSYHFVPAVHDALGVVAGWQARFGVAFSGVGYLFFCGILPPFICLFVPSLRPKEPVKAFAFAIIFWSVMGLAIAQFYLLQAVLFGNGSDLATLVKKVLVDQFVFSPFLSVPIVSIVHAWKDRGYRWSSLRPVLGKGWYSRLALPTLIMNWAVWFPSLFVIYSMPTPLQPHIAGLVSGFWSLMCLQIAARTKQEAA
ncbi:MAG: hypothetical protein ACOX9C_10915 [Kiritimatiellia bacterium]